MILLSDARHAQPGGQLVTRGPYLLSVHGRWAIEYPVDSLVSQLVYLTSEQNDCVLDADDLPAEELQVGGDGERSVRVKPASARLKRRHGRLHGAVHQLIDALLKTHRPDPTREKLGDGPMKR
jgi:hypothetical protein